MSFLEPLVRHNAPPAVRKFLRQHGSDEIINMIVCRIPIQKGIDKFINIITAGKYEKNKTRMKYEDMYHLFIVAELYNPARGRQTVRYRIEKNHVVTITRTTKFAKEFMGVPMSKSIYVSDLFANAEKVQGSNFWLYDAVTNNCQVFIMNLLGSNGLLNEGLSEFIKQDAEKIINKKVGKIARFITDIAGVADTLVYGKGFNMGLDI
jgi:hypothetical protein